MVTPVKSPIEQAAMAYHEALRSHYALAGVPNLIDPWEAVDPRIRQMTIDCVSVAIGAYNDAWQSKKA